MNSIITSMEQSEHPGFVARMRQQLPHWTDDQIVEAVNLIANTCHHCWSADASCVCWRDE